MLKEDKREETLSMTSQSPEQKQKKKETEAILSKQRAKEKAEHKVNTI